MCLQTFNNFRILLFFNCRLLIVLSVFSLSVNANDLWTRYQFINLEVPVSSGVNTLYEDQLGQIWVGSDNGLYRIQNNVLQKVSHGPKSSIEHILQAGNNDIWMATSDGVWRWQNQSNKFSTLACADEQSFSQLTKHPTLGLMALSRSGVYQLSDRQVCQKLSFNGLPEDAQIERITVFDRKLMLAVRGLGLFQCSAECNHVFEFSPDLSNTRVRELAPHNNTLYVGTHKHGFYALNNHGSVQLHWHRNAATAPYDFTLPVNGVMTLLPTENNIWAGLWAGGLQQFDIKSGKKVSSSQYYAPDTTTVGGRHVSALLESNHGTLYIGHENGVSVLLPAYNQQGWIGLANDSQIGLSNDKTFSLYQYNDVSIAGTSSGGLYFIGLNNNKLIHLSPDAPAPFNLPTKSIWQITDSQRGDLLLGTSNGVMRLNPNTFEWQLFGDPNKLKSTDVYSLTEAPDQTSWLSLWEGGIARLDAKGQLIGQWSNKDGLAQNTSAVIASTNDNQVFVLNNSGLFRYDHELDKFVDTELKKLQNNCVEVTHLTTDLTGQLWALCQHNSLWRYKEGIWFNAIPVTTEPIRHLISPFSGHKPNTEHLFLLSDNHVFALDINGQIMWQQTTLPMNNAVAIRQAAVVNNELITGTNQGLYRQKLHHPFLVTQLDAPVISGVRLFNKPWEINETDPKADQPNDSIELYHGQLQLNYDQDLITFEFAVPGFNHEPIQGFNYRLLPYDKRWLTTAENEATASYTRLLPGRYQFEVKAIASNGLPPATFQLSIMPPWYLTWWAKTLAFFTVLVSILAVILGRTRRLKQSNLLLQKSVKARTVELEQANKMLQQTADLDALTGLLNRRGLLNLCDSNWTQWQGEIILMIADIDHFKRVNDQFGHQGGDHVLITCALRLKKHAGDQDIIARWGGEEFLILLRDEPKTSFDHLKSRAQKLQRIVGETTMNLGSKEITLTMTAGICEHQGESFDSCLQMADQKLYQGKNSGRNRLIMYLKN